MFTNKDMWNWHSTHGDISDIVTRRFLRSTTDEAILLKHKLIVNTTSYEVAATANSILDEHISISGDTVEHFHLSGLFNNKAILIHVKKISSYLMDDDDDYPPSKTDDESPLEGQTIVSIEVIGPHKEGKDFLNILKEKVSKIQASVSVIRWWYKTHHNNYSTREIFMDAPKTILHKVFYPRLKADPVQYISDYLKSDESVLFLFGDPGTGKTTFLRHMIYDFKLSADVVYDEEALKSDNVFQNFLFESNSTVLVVEDADAILGERRKEQNTLMARFLSITEGLVRFPNKKLVFTTNLKDVNEVDPALRRPGRSFGTIHTMEFSHEEALAVCQFMNWPVPIDMHKKKYTVAELAHNKENPKQSNKMGYVG